MLTVNMQGTKVPSLGFGTYLIKGNECRKAVANALAIGYRHIDTAQIYENEAEVGLGLADAKLDRDSFFVTTKVWIDNATARKVRSSTEESLKKLRLDHVDLLLLHWPVADVPLEETLKAMDTLLKEGKTKAIGVSNFTVALMREAVEKLGFRIACNQVEYHVQLSQKLVLDYARQHEIVVTAYSPLGRAKLVDHPVLVRIGQKHGKTGAQVALRWLIEQEGVLAIPKAASDKNARANFNVFDFSLDVEDRQAIDALGGNNRLVNPSFAPSWDEAA